MNQRTTRASLACRFGSLCGVATHTAESNNLTFGIHNPDNIVFFELSHDLYHTYRQKARAGVVKNSIGCSFVDMNFSFSKTFAMANPGFHT